MRPSRSRRPFKAVSHKAAGQSNVVQSPGTTDLSFGGDVKRDGPRTRTVVCLLTMIVIVAAGLRLVRLGDQSFWTDEFFAMAISSGHGATFHRFGVDPAVPLPLPDLTRPDADASFSSIWNGLERDSHPPLHFLLLAVWRSLFGHDEVAARSLSAVCSLALIGVVIDAVRRQAGWSCALWVGGILAISGVQIAYAREARNYALAMFIVYAAAALVLRCARVRAMDGWAMVALTSLFLAGMLTHYLVIGPFAGLAVWFFISMPLHARVRLAVSICVAAGLFAIVWGPTFLTQRRLGLVEMTRWMGYDAGYGWTAVVRRLARWGWDAIVADPRSPAWVRGVSSLGLIGAIAAAVRDARIRLWIAIVIGTLAHVIAVDAFEGTDRLAIVRYSVLAAPAFVAAVCLSVDRVPALRQFVPLLMLSACAYRIDVPFTERKPEWRTFARQVAAQVGPNDVILLKGEHVWQSEVCVLAFGHYGSWATAARPRVAVITDLPSSELVDRIRSEMSSGRVYVLISPFGGVPHAWLPGTPRRARVIADLYPHAAVWQTAWSDPPAATQATSSMSGDDGGGRDGQGRPGSTAQ